ncbi:hypothetical protein CTAYLR_004983 [Chrysophaeum taylorii]|uniref:Adenylate kinase isoenzyme 6 homolog n=1 Tax=Chrysophaeum taylorii TaxID=2483200 RepID=A0AAD7UAN5_9STRA|nr:hypothetical protein CTAYLR_004983 [Chrysophaeum taylorii]
MTKRSAVEASTEERTAQKGRTWATRPNVLVCGTPGTGKTEMSAAIARKVKMQHLNVGDLAARLDAYDGWDEDRQCHILNEDRVLDEMEILVSKGGCVVDYHACDFFPERWFDLVLVLRATTEVLFDRLTARNYAHAKIQENLQCEIMQVLLDEARDNYPEPVVVEVQNNTRLDFDSTIDRVVRWHDQWLRDHAPPSST